MCLRILRQVIEQIAEIHIGAIAQRGETGETDLRVACPVEHRRRERTGLRDESQIAR